MDKRGDYEKIMESMPESGGYTYRKILHVDLDQDRCDVLKSDPDGWQPGEGPLSVQLEQFARGGAVHPDDVERFTAFTRPEQLRRAAGTGQEAATLIYRRREEGGYRWNLMEAVLDRAGGGRTATLCVKDIHDVLREGQEREGIMARLHALEDHAYIVSSLSGLFFSTYYLDLEHDSFRAVTQLHRVENVLGSEVNCTSAMRIYANHFIHPDDREEYLRVMNVENLRQCLRWWKPCAAVEYRKLPDEPGAGGDSWGWVRATAVLARAGEDDMPRTAVYVAQDISEGRRERCTVPERAGA